jgi:hypothetical protein
MYRPLRNPLVLSCKILLIIPESEGNTSVTTEESEPEVLGTCFDRSAMAELLVTVAMINNRTFIANIRRVLMLLVHKQIGQLAEDDADDGSGDPISSNLQAMNLEDDDDQSEDSEDLSDICEDYDEDIFSRLPGFRLSSHEVFDKILDKLPTGYQSYKIKIDFENGYLYVKTVPGLIHSKAATAFQDTITFWARNGGTIPPTTLSPLENYSNTSIVPLENSCLFG